MILAPATAIDEIKRRMTAVYPGVLEAVCVERGVVYADADYPFAVKATRATVRPEDVSNYEYPFVWIGAIPDGEVEGRGSDSMTSVSRVTCFVADRHPDGEVLATRLMCHLLALSRTFEYFEGTGYTGYLTDWTGTPPYAPSEDLWVGSAGVQIDVRVAEDTD